MKKIAAIGLGRRIAAMAGMFIKTGKCELVAVTDIDFESAKMRAKERINDSDEYVNSIHFYEDYHEMIEKEKIDGILIGTRCSTHAKIGADLLKYGIPLFMEKPIATTEEDLQLLRDAVKSNPEMMEKCVVSFPLRYTNLVQHTKKIIDSGELGRIEHVQAINNVPYGRVYYHGWYRDENETGGLWLQKATHDFDYITYILGIKPVSVCAMSSKQIFKGDKPADLTCSTCPESDTCPESTENIAYYANEDVMQDLCCFSTATGNQDSGTAIIEYESGMHVVYSQNFFARKGAGKRGARFLGYDGTVEFDWTTGEVKVFMHNRLRSDVIKFDVGGSHGGGDDELVRNFIDIMNGKAVSNSTIDEGILSAHMCLMAEKASKTHTYQKI